MPWVRLDDGFPENVKIIGLSDKAFRLHVEALCYAARNLTDGFIPAAALPALRGTKRAAGELVSARLWETSADPAGWSLHDFLEFNPAAKDVKQKRADASERMRKRRAKPPADDDGSPNVRANGASTFAERSREVREPHPQPVPDPVPDLSIREAAS